MYKEGDIIPGVGQVIVNHAGVPWVVGMNGEIYYGVVQVDRRQLSGSATLCDALSGELLNMVEILRRKNNEEYDYESKLRNNAEWRRKNQPKGPYAYKHKKFNGFQRIWRWLRRLL